MEAAYRKYPNPHNPNVQALDVLERRVERGRGRLFSHRIFTTLWNVPLIVLQVYKITVGHGLAIIIISDTRNKSLHVYT